MVVGSQENPVTICQAALMKPITSDAVVPGTQHGTKDRKMDFKYLVGNVRGGK